MKTGDYVSIARYHKGIRMDVPPITGLVVERCTSMPSDYFKISFRIKILETTGELTELIVSNHDVTEILIGERV